MDSKWLEIIPTPYDNGDTDMVRLVAILVVLAIIAAVLIYGMRTWRKRSLDRYLAEHDPEQLDSKRIDPKIAKLLVERRRTIELQDEILHDGMVLGAQLLAMPKAFEFGEHHASLHRWLDRVTATQRKEISK